MKKTEISPTYVIIWVVILIVAYGIGFCVHELKLSKMEAAENKILSQEIQDTKLYIVSDILQEDVSAQRRIRQQNTNTTNRNSAFSTGRGGQMGRGGGMQNFSQQDLATIQEQQRQMMQMMQNMGGNQGNQMTGGYDPTTMTGGFDPATMMGGYDPGTMGGPQMMGGFDPGAMIAPDAMGDPGVLNPPEPQVEN